MTSGSGRPKRAACATRPCSHRDKCHDVQFSPDGRLMALASYDGSVRVRDFATGTVVAELPAHPDMVYSASFSPDGRLLVTACRDRTVRVWDWRAGRLACPPFEHAKDAVAAIFTPDGRWVLSVSDDGTARAWDWRTGKPVTPSLAIEGEPLERRRDPGRQACGRRRGPGRRWPCSTWATWPRATPTPTRTRCACGPRCSPASGSTKGAAQSTSRPTEWLDRWRAFRRQSTAARIVEPHADLGAASSGRAGGPGTNADSSEAVGRMRVVQ